MVWLRKICDAKIKRDKGMEICQNIKSWAIGAAGAQVPYKHKVGGSNPSSPTIDMLAERFLSAFFGMNGVLS